MFRYEGRCFFEWHLKAIPVYPDKYFIQYFIPKIICYTSLVLLEYIEGELFHHVNLHIQGTVVLGLLPFWSSHNILYKYIMYRALTIFFLICMTWFGSVLQMTIPHCEGHFWEPSTPTWGSMSWSWLLEEKKKIWGSSLTAGCLSHCQSGCLTGKGKLPRKQKWILN